MCRTTTQPGPPDLGAAALLGGGLPIGPCLLGGGGFAAQPGALLEGGAAPTGSAGLLRLPFLQPLLANLLAGGGAAPGGAGEQQTDGQAPAATTAAAGEVAFWPQVAAAAWQQQAAALLQAQQLQLPLPFTAASLATFLPGCPSCPLAAAEAEQEEGGSVRLVEVKQEECQQQEAGAPQQQGGQGAYPAAAAEAAAPAPDAQLVDVNQEPVGEQQLVEEQQELSDEELACSALCLLAGSGGSGASDHHHGAAAGGGASPRSDEEAASIWAPARRLARGWEQVQEAQAEAAQRPAKQARRAAPCAGAPPPAAAALAGAAAVHVQERRIVTGPDPDRFYCPHPGCERSFAELWRLKVHYRAPPDVRGSGRERGHGTDLQYCPKCGKDLPPGKHHVGCSAGKAAPRQAAKRQREAGGRWG